MNKPSIPRGLPAPALPARSAPAPGASRETHREKAAFMRLPAFPPKCRHLLESQAAYAQNPRETHLSKKPLQMRLPILPVPRNQLTTNNLDRVHFCAQLTARPTPKNRAQNPASTPGGRWLAALGSPLNLRSGEHGEFAPERWGVPAGNVHPQTSGSSSHPAQPSRESTPFT